VGELTESHLGQLVDYHSRVSGPVRGVVFNARAFWLLETVRNLPVALTKGEWGARGSRALFRRFFDALPEPPLVPLLRHICRSLSVVPRSVAALGEAAPDGSETHVGAFLGAGGSARVFRVVAAEGAGAAPPAALKVSTSLSRAELEYEFSTLLRAAAAGAPVVPAVADSLVIFVDGASGAHRGGGFLLRDVCTRAAMSSGSRCKTAFASLRALHAAGFAHGDARLPNLVERGNEEFLWIDMRAAGVGALAAAQGADARALAASTLGVAQGGELPAPASAALADVPDGGEAAYDALAAAVWRCKSE